jgi:hypothetical protein
MLFAHQTPPCRSLTFVDSCRNCCTIPTPMSTNRCKTQMPKVGIVVCQPYHCVLTNSWCSLVGVDSFGTLSQLQVPRHWMRALFGVMALRGLQRNVASLRLCAALTPTFAHSHWLRAQHALACYNLREFDAAARLFQQQLNEAPSRLDDLDAYSNILYVQEDAAKLSLLAHHATRVDRYRPETCNIVGNYYSMKGECRALCIMLLIIRCQQASMSRPLHTLNDRCDSIRAICRLGR